MATDNKYDRQIRLWGYHGQKLLYHSKICLIGSSGPGVEAIKNLVLPGCGHITIWDDAIVTPRDIGTNFFLERSSVTKPRAAETLRLLLEMNPDVRGDAVLQSPQELLSSELFQGFTIFIANQLPETLKVQLSKRCAEQSKPIVFINTNGFYGYVRIQSVCHEIFQKKDKQAVYDLRITEPFPELVEHVDSIPLLDLMNSASTSEESKDQLAHVPYLVILLQAIKAAQSTKLTDIEPVLNTWSKSLPYEDNQNFGEAKSNIKRLLRETVKKNIEEIKLITEHPQSINATADSPDFWKLARVLKAYIQKYEDYPQGAALPDMKSDTVSYIALKELYRAQQHKTAAQFAALIPGIFPGYTPPADVLQRFLGNILSLGVLEMRPYYEQYESPEFTDENNYPAIYIAMRAAALFKQKNKRNASINDIQELTKIAESLAIQFSRLVDTEVLKEIARTQGAELITISSIVGAVAAQEAVKLITHQFIPMETGYMFDGLTSTGTMVTL